MRVGMLSYGSKKSDCFLGTFPLIGHDDPSHLKLNAFAKDQTALAFSNLSNKTQDNMRRLKTI
jgi:hypothetical protein